MSIRKSEFGRPPVLKRAVATVLALAAIAAAAAGCAGGDSARERPASPNYQRLPIR